MPLIIAAHVRVTAEFRIGSSADFIMPPWSVYMVRCKDGSLYTGIAIDVERRIAKHNAGEGAKYTRSRRPVMLVWSEVVESESAARVKEIQMKKMTKSAKEKLLSPAES